MADNTNKTIHTLVDSDGKPVVLATVVQPRANGDDTSVITEGSGSGLRCIRLNIVDAQSMTSIEEVDVYTTADAVYYNTATKETIIDYINFRLAYTNSVPLPEDIGAFHKGDIFNEMDLKDVLEGILYPNISPTVELSCDKDLNNLYKVGEDIVPVTFTLKLSNVFNGAATLAYLIKDGSNIATFANLPNGDGSTTYVYNGEVEKEHVFKASVTFPTEVIESNELEIPFVSPTYVSWGIATRPNTDNPISFLQNNTNNILTIANIEKTYNIDEAINTGYMLFAFPERSDNQSYNIMINGINCTSMFEIIGAENTLLPNDKEGNARQYSFFISYIPISAPMKLSVEFGKSGENLSI